MRRERNPCRVVSLASAQLRYRTFLESGASLVVGAEEG